MRFDNIITNILKEEAPSREDRIKAMDNFGKKEEYKVCRFTYKINERRQLIYVRSLYEDDITADSIESAYNILISKLKKLVPNAAFQVKRTVSENYDVGWTSFSNNGYDYDFIVIGPSSEYYKVNLLGNEEAKEHIIDQAVEGVD